MSNIHRVFVLFVLAMYIASCGAPVPIVSPTASPAPSSTPEPMPTVSIARYPEPEDYSHLHPQLTAIPTYDPKSVEAWQVDPQIDLRSQNLTSVEMANSLTDLLAAAFDSKTQWPAADKIPAGFDPHEIMEIGKDPGLGIRALHEQGITGENVGIAIIDQTLLVEHVEYKDRIRLYEETSNTTFATQETSMHGAGVASLAVGKTVGVAPEADLYYIEVSTCNSYNFKNPNYSCLIEAIKRILEINNTLPSDRKIRVLSIANIGWDSKGPIFEEISESLKEAADAGIFVITRDLYESHGFHFEGLGREALSDPNRFESYLPPPLWAKYFYQGIPFESTLFIPMDSRTTASPTGVNDYVFYRWGDLSWTIPYLAGVYALACQVQPAIIPEKFWETAMSTGKMIQIRRDGQEYELGVILDPQALLEDIKSK